MNDLNALVNLISGIVDERYEKLKCAKTRNYIAYNHGRTNEKMTHFEIHISYNNPNSSLEAYSTLKRVQLIGKAVGVSVLFNNQDANATDDLS